MWLTIYVIVMLLLFVYLPIHLLGSWSSFPAFVYWITLFGYLLWKPSSRMRWDAFRGWSGFSRFISWYFKLEIRGKLLHDTTVVYGIHPHGVASVGHIVGFALDKSLIGRVRPMAIGFLFYLPFIKELLGWTHCVGSSHREVKDALFHCFSVSICPGGLHEAPGVIDPSVDYVSKRGFIRLACSQGVPVVPVWVEGEDEMYHTWSPFPSLQRFCLERTRYPWMVVGWGYGFWPRRKPLIIHVGDPIPTSPTSNVQEVHDQFYLALDELKSRSSNCCP